MTMRPLGILVRRSRRAIATAQVLAFAGALMVEGGFHSGQNASPTATALSWFKSVARVHDALTCPACVLMRTPARLPDAQRIPPWDVGSCAPREVTIDGPPQRIAEQSLFSRAPPPSLLRA